MNHLFTYTPTVCNCSNVQHPLQLSLQQTSRFTFILIASMDVILSLHNYNMWATIWSKNFDKYKVHTILYNIYVDTEWGKWANLSLE